jgi:hypothetical protein
LPYCCQFYQHFMCAFCADILAPNNFKPKTQLCNFRRQNFEQKTLAQNVDELNSGTVFVFDSRRSFPRKKMVLKFGVNVFFTLIESYNINLGVNFTNIFAFTQTNSKSTKKYSQMVSLFCAFGI